MSLRLAARRLAPLALALVAATASRAGRVSLVDVRRCLLPLVALPPGGGDYTPLGNAVLLDRDGHLVAPQGALTGMDARLLLPAPRLGVLVPRGDEVEHADVRDLRTFVPVKVLRLDRGEPWALLEATSDLGSAAPPSDGGALGLGDEVQVLGFGAPGILPHLWRAAVVARLPAPSHGEGAFRYALDAGVTEAADGGLVFDPQRGAVHALATFHHRHVHRVVQKQADFEYGPTGAALGIPLAEVQAWLRAALDELGATPAAPDVDADTTAEEGDS